MGPPPYCPGQCWGGSCGLASPVPKPNYTSVAVTWAMFSSVSPDSASLYFLKVSTDTIFIGVPSGITTYDLSFTAYVISSDKIS